VTESRERAEPPPAPNQVVGPAIQRLAAARLGRGFLPLGVLLLVGLGEMISGRVPGSGPLLLAVGAPASAGAMLAYGLGVVQRAFGRERRPWWPLATAGGLVPLAFGVYVLGWRGLRLVAGWNGIPEVLTGVFFTLLGFWILRSWQRLSELETLATVMTLGATVTEDGPGTAGDPGRGEEGGA
jgi:hypothetical protein